MRAAAPAPIEIWGGLECTVARIGDDYRDLLAETGHRDRPQDLDAIAALGIRTLRYPVLWEHVAPDHPTRADWSWHDERLARLAELGITPIVGLLHHGSGPRYTNLLDPRFPGSSRPAMPRQVARRYPVVEHVHAGKRAADDRPVQLSLRPVASAHARIRTFLRALFHECYGTALAMRRIRRVTPKAHLVQTEDIGKTFSTPCCAIRPTSKPASLAQPRPAVRPGGPRITLGSAHSSRRCPGGGRCAIWRTRPCPPDIVGINYYLSTDRFLDQRL